MIYVSAGAYVREIDLSLYVPALGGTIMGMVGTATKGPMNDPVFVSSQADYIRKFGPPDDSVGYMSYAALQFLRRGNRLWIVRVGVDGVHAASTVNIIGAATPADVTSDPNAWGAINAPTPAEVVGTSLFPQDVSVNNSLVIEVLLNGSDIEGSDFTIDVSEIASVPATAGAQEVCDAINNNINYAYHIGTADLSSGFTVVDNTNDELKVRITDQDGGVHVYEADDVTPLTPGVLADLAAVIAEIQNFIDEPTVADVRANNTNYLEVFTADGVKGVAAPRIEILATATGADCYTDLGWTIGTYTATEKLVTNVVDTDDKDTYTTVYDPWINQSAGYIRFLHKTDGAGPGQNAFTFQAATTCDTELGITEDEEYPGDPGTNKLTIRKNVGLGDEYSAEIEFPDGMTAATVAKATIDASGETVAAKLDIYAIVTATNQLKLRRRTGGDTETLEVTSASTADVAMGGEFDDHAVHAGLAAGGDTIQIDALTPGTWGDRLRAVVSDGSLIGTFALRVYERGMNADSLYNVVETWDNLDYTDGDTNYFEDVINASVGGSQYIEVTDLGADSIPQNGTATLTGGNNGILGIGPTEYIGSNPTPTGLQIFRAAELIDVNLLAVPGVYEASVINAMIEICETRGDCMCLVDPPPGLTSQDVVDWHNGTGAYTGLHAAFNSSYAALYWPWIEIFDVHNNQELITPPSGHVAAVYAYTDYIRELWVAPAGLQRGRLPAAIKLETISPSQGERDLLYGYPNNVNPIVAFTQQGITVWGQKTLWRSPTAVDRVNVRRLLLFARKIVATSVRYLVFEPNDEGTWASFINLIEPWLEGIKTKRGLYEFKVVCDETTNPPEQIDQGIMVGQIFLRPTKAAEIIVVDFILTNTGTSFEEIIY
jgi:phage tail sheath protein FI